MTPSDYKKKQKLKGQDINISNSLIESFVSQSNLMALKVLFYLSYDDSVVLPDAELLTLRLDTKDMCNKIEVDARTLKRSFKIMQKTTVTFVKEDEYVEDVVVIPSIKYITGTTKIEVKIFKKVFDLVRDVEKKFTPIDIKNLMKLRSKHSVRMIQLLYYINTFGANVPKRKSYNLEQVNGMWGTNYKTLFDFKRKVLDKVKTELDCESSLSFEAQIKFESVPRGRPKSVGIVFDLIKNTQPKLF